MSAHPAEADSALFAAERVALDLTRIAIERGDNIGARAWERGAAAIAEAAQIMREARMRQNWGGPGPHMVKPPRGRVLGG